MIDLQDVLAARDRIRGIVAVTPCPLSEPFSELCGARIHFKLENLHRTGSFKERGAANLFALLTPDERKRGVVAASAGNHAQGVAINAQRLGIQATIVMPATAPLSKVEATRKLGAQIVLSGNNYDEAYAEARRLQQERGFVFIHAFDDDAIIAGQGTAALEIVEQVPGVEVLVASIGGGGFLGGMALAVKSLKPSVRVVGVESSHLPKMRAALDAGGPIVIPNATTIADGIAIKRAGERTLPLFRKYVDELVDVLAEQRERPFSGPLDRDSVRDRGRVRDHDRPSSVESGAHLRQMGGFDTDDAHRRLQRLHRQGHPAEKASSSDRGDQHVDVRHLLQDLQRRRALARDDRVVVEGMDEDEALLLLQPARLGVRIVVVVAAEHDVG